MGVPDVLKQKRHWVGRSTHRPSKDLKCLDTTHYYYHNVILIMLGEFGYLLIVTTAGLGDKPGGRGDLTSTRRGQSWEATHRLAFLEN